MTERRATAAAIFVAVTSAMFRLVTLQWLHPLNWDEVEFYRASRWVGEGLVPFRDFWEHHTPLAFFVFAPFTRLTDSPGVWSVILLRWAQVPVWIATFWLANVFMRDAAVSRFARWAAMAVALSATILMNPAVEFRLDPLACALFMAGMVWWKRGTASSMFGAGAMFCLAGLANMRLVPLLAVTVLLLRVVNPAERAWKGSKAANWMYPGGLAVGALFALYVAVTRSFRPFVRILIDENRIGNEYARTVLGAFPHRLLTMFGVRVMGSDRLFDAAAIDLGGITVFVLGIAGLVIVLRRFRAPDALVVLAILELVGFAVVAGMKFVYVYHFELIVVMLLPFIAVAVERIPRRGVVTAMLVAVWCVNGFASLFRGKELDLAYQDLILREVHARTRPDETCFSGAGWGFHRRPSYRLWFLPDMTKFVVWQGYEPPYDLRRMVADPPAVVVLDHSVMVWTLMVQRELAPYIARHYVPVWGDLWVPGMSSRLTREAPFAEWIVPRDGDYRLFASPQLGRHVWFVNPYYISAMSDEAEPPSYALTLPAPAANPELQWLVDGQPANFGPVTRLKKGQRIGVRYGGTGQIGVILLPGKDNVLFRFPPGGAALEAATSRRTHVPRLGARIE